MADDENISVGKSILKGLKSAGLLTAGLAVTAAATQLSDPTTAADIFHRVPVAVPLGALLFQFAGTALANFAKQKLLKR